MLKISGLSVPVSWSLLKQAIVAGRDVSKSVPETLNPCARMNFPRSVAVLMPSPRLTQRLPSASMNNSHTPGSLLLKCLSLLPEGFLWLQKHACSRAGQAGIAGQLTLQPSANKGQMLMDKHPAFSPLGGTILRHVLYIV